MVPTPGELTECLLKNGQFRWIFFWLTIGFMILSIGAMVLGGFTIGGDLAAVTAAAATVLLVAITSQYVAQTRDLVEENQKIREQREQRHQRQKQDELAALRRSLHTEISKVGSIGNLVPEGEYRGQNVTESVFPRTIYEENADKIGLLTEDERDAIVSYYSLTGHLDHLTSEWIRAKQANNPLPVIGPNNDTAIKQLENRIAQWTEATEEAQQEAISALELHIKQENA